MHDNLETISLENSTKLIIDPKENKPIYENISKFNFILGYYNFDNNPIMVAWDPYRYLKHNTLRSCYVTIDTLKRGYERGFYEGVVSSQKLWVFKGEYFDTFIQKYIEYVTEYYMKGNIQNGKQ